MHVDTIRKGNRPAPRRFRPTELATALLLMGLALTAFQCSPEARHAHCRNDSECPDADRGRAYCVHSRCVECVTHASCGERKRCAAGTCVSRNE